MFFTIVIPTYNPGDYLRKMLESITHNDCANDMEVILSDDISTESFNNIIEEFKDRLFIRTIRNDKHYGFPRTGRQNGAEAATGQWMCFADQDDYFIDHAFDNAKAYIEEHNVQYYLAYGILKESSVTNESIFEAPLLGWTHGKFFEKKFWDEYNIKYDDVQYCEDSNLVTKVCCVLFSLGIEPQIVNEPAYVWYAREDSLSNGNSGEYFVKSMPDYIKGTFKVVLDFYEKYRDTEELANKYLLNLYSVIYHLFFYLQAPHFDDRKDVVLNTILLLQPLYEKMKELSGLTNDDIVRITSNELLVFYNSIRSSDSALIPFIEKLSFKDWIHTYFNENK